MTSPRVDLDGENAYELTGKQGKVGSWGLLWYHTDPATGEPCGPGGISWDPDDVTHWDLISMNPLTVSPSLLCMKCKRHGFIREGTWVGV